MLVEGQTEQTFVRDQLAARFGAVGIAVWPVLSGKAGKQGGAPRWHVARKDIQRVLKRGHYCTTMFDFYGLPLDWPGRAEASGLPWQDRAEHVERALADDISTRMGSSFNPARFVPYVQLHEFEALLFADLEALVAVTGMLSQTPPARLREAFGAILTEAHGQPEAIDDGFDTCPSHRIASLVPAYRKRLHGSILVARIGLNAMIANCPHFGEWVGALEALGTRAE